VSGFRIQNAIFSNYVCSFFHPLPDAVRNAAPVPSFSRGTGDPFRCRGPSERSFKLQTVVSDDNYPPCIFRDVQGNLQGILIDERGLCEKRTGINVDFRGMDWGKAQRFMAGGNADVIEVGEGQLKSQRAKECT
jgi:hypothetical protein